jgi:hypothetical protein
VLTADVLCCAVNLQAKGEDGEVVKAVDVHRAKFGLKPLRETNFATLLEQQKEETVDALARVRLLHFNYHYYLFYATALRALRVTPRHMHMPALMCMLALSTAAARPPRSVCSFEPSSVSTVAAQINNNS